MATRHASVFGSTTAELRGAFEAQVIFTCLPDSDVVSSVVTSMMDVIKEGTILVDCTSGDPKQTRAIASQVSEVGCSVVDAPISGGPDGAKRGALAAMVGGDARDIAKVLPFLSLFCTKIKHVGPVGSGHSVKAINNALNASHLCMAAEGLLSLVRVNISAEDALSAINASSGRSLQTEVRIPTEVLTRKFSYGFKVGLMLKDVRIANSICGGSNGYFNRTEKLLAQAVEEEGFDADYTAVVRTLERGAGFELRQR